jgi:hypothetical protein
VKAVESERGTEAAVPKDMRSFALIFGLTAVACAGPGTRVPQTQTTAEPASAASAAPFCAIELRAPETWQATLEADDVAGVDCIPPAGGEVFSLGFAHAGWWLQLDIARTSLTVGAPHTLDGQAKLLALDCWQWDGAVTVDADDRDHWALRIDAQCRDDDGAPIAGKRVSGSFSGRAM